MRPLNSDFFRVKNGPNLSVYFDIFFLSLKFFRGLKSEIQLLACYAYLKGGGGAMKKILSLLLALGLMASPVFAASEQAIPDKENKKLINGLV